MPQVFKVSYLFNNIVVYVNFYSLYVVPPHCHYFCFCAGYGHFYFRAMGFRWYAIVCKSSSDVAIKIWSSAYSIVFTNFLLFSYIPFFITIFNSCIILFMYILNNTGERPHPCLTVFFQKHPGQLWGPSNIIFDGYDGRSYKDTSLHAFME